MIPLLSIGQDTQISTFGGEGVVISHFNQSESGKLWISGTFDSALDLGLQTISSRGQRDIFLASFDGESAERQLVLSSSSDDIVSGMRIGTSRNYLLGQFWDSLYVDGQLAAVSRFQKAVFLMQIDERFNYALTVIEGNRFKDAIDLVVSGDDPILVINFRDSLFTGDSVFQSDINSVFVGAYGEDMELKHGRVIGGAGSIRAHTAAKFKNDVLVAGRFQGNVAGGGLIIETNTLDDDGWLASLDGENLAVTDLTKIGGVFEDEVIDISVRNDTVLLAGNFIGRVEFDALGTLESSGFERDIFLYTLDPNLQLVRSEKIGGDGGENVSGVTQNGKDWWISGVSDGMFEIDDQPIKNKDQGRHGFVLRGTRIDSFDVILTDTGFGTSEFTALLTLDTLLRMAGTYSGEPVINSESLPFSPAVRSFVGTWMRTTPVVPQPVGDFRLYPNPVTQSLTLEFPDNTESLELFDTSGRLIRRMDPIPNMDVADLLPGIYILVAYKDSGSSDEIMFVKY